MNANLTTEGLAPKLEERIKEIINSDRVVIYMKGSKDFPMCGFSATAVGIFKALQVPFTTFDVLKDPEVREGIKSFSQWPTIPQVYLNGEFIGGSDVLRQLYEGGELKELVSQALQLPRTVV